MQERRFSLGLDFGTNSVRALLVDITSGEEIADYVFHYEQGDDGVIQDALDANVARQHPGDYIKGLDVCFREILSQASRIKGFLHAQLPQAHFV